MIWTDEKRQWLIDNVKGISQKELLKRFNKHFNENVTLSSIRNQKVKLHLHSGIKGGQFQKGHTPINKGLKWNDYMPKESQEKAKKTWFYKGQKSINKRPVGSERINVDGYIEIKVADPNKWKLKHRVIWEETHGEIPKGNKIIFLDGNKLNLDINNLMCVTGSGELYMNRYRYFANDADLTRAGAMIAQVVAKTHDLNKGR